MAVLLILASVYVLTGSVSNGQLFNMTDDADHDSQNQTGSYANLYHLKKRLWWLAYYLSHYTLHWKVHVSRT